MKRSLDKLFFFICLSIFFLGISFTCGMISQRYKVFPFKLIKEAYLGAKALKDTFSGTDDGSGGDKDRIRGIAFYDDLTSGPNAAILEKNAGNEKIFVLSNGFAYSKGKKDGSFAWIMDRSGNILHAWKDVPDIWTPLQNRDAVPGKWVPYPVGAYLFPNGDLLVSYHGDNVFPYAMGLAKFDKNSNLLWKNAGYFHHWFDVDEENRIWTPGFRIVNSPLKVPDNSRYFTCNQEKMPIDVIYVLNPDGDIVSEIDIFESFVRSGLMGVFNNNGNFADAIKTCDPLHLNDIKVIMPLQAEKNGRLNSGDLLLSFRSINSVGLLDRNSKLFSWFHSGATLFQHSPRIVGGNRIFTFDNHGGKKSMGTSRIVSVSLEDGSSETIFPREGVTIPDRDFFSDTAGHIGIHPNEKRMLVSWTYKGLVWEIDIESGQVLWEFVNTHPLEDGKSGRLEIHASLYADFVDFEMNDGVFGK